MDLLYLKNSPLAVDARKIYSVSEVTFDLKSLLEDNFPSLWVKGEISNFKESPNGHYYFVLKDEFSQMSLVMFRGQNRLLKFRLEDGMEVLAHGHLTVYQPRGQCQMVSDHLEPCGVGALQLAFEQLKAKLEAEGLFDSKRKRELPLLPRKVGIITSPKGAVFHDMKNVIKRRFPNMDLVFFSVQVQGEGAAAQIVQAISLANQRDDIDVLIVGRGGGSIEDLWAFNEEIVVRSIVSSRIPVVSAVGHETDFTLADFAADLRAPTPSAAAELVVPEKDQLLLDLKRLELALVNKAKNFLEEREQKLDERVDEMKDAEHRFLEDHTLRLSFLSKQIISPQQVLDRLDFKRQRAMDFLIKLFPRYLKEVEQDFQKLVAHLGHLSPLAPLARGYSLALNSLNGNPIKSRSEAAQFPVFDLKFSDGTLKVKSTTD